MPDTSADEVVELLKQAAKGGRITVITPGQQHNAEPPLVVACRLLFKLTRAESRGFVQLLEHEHVSRETLHAVTAPGGVPVSKLTTVDVIVCRMRAKLAPHGSDSGSPTATEFASSSAMPSPRPHCRPTQNPTPPKKNAPRS